MRTWLLVAAALVALLDQAGARPGGGQGYSGGSSGGGYSGGGSSGGSYSAGGGDSSGGGELIYLLFRLLFEVPQLGVPLLIAVVGGYIWFKRSTAIDRTASWDSVELLPPPPPPPVEEIVVLDPEFSQVLFEDLLFRLYSQAHRARSDAAALAGLAPYLSGPAREALALRPPAGSPVSDVVVGAMRIADVRMPPRAGNSYATAGSDGKPVYVKVWIDFEANMTAGEHTQYVRERWRVARMASAKSRPPARARDFHCPNCAAPFHSSDGQTCQHCGQVVSNGRFEWIVSAIELQHAEDRPPPLGGYSVEQGTYGTTVEQPALVERLAALREADPAFNDEGFARRLRLIYQEVNAGWSEQDLARMRPFTSDGLHDYLRYWIEAYQRQDLVNRMDQAAISNWRYTKVTHDAHYHAITVRLWASGLDFTLAGKSGRVVGGSRSEPRVYSEYWTLIRGAGVRGAPRSDKRCPNCGAELKITMAGSCEFCSVHVTAGEFDWVLSKIEQDDSYRG
jgi:hypothetical protein